MKRVKTHLLSTALVLLRRHVRVIQLVGTLSQRGVNIQTALKGVTYLLTYLLHGAESFLRS